MMGKILSPVLGLIAGLAVGYFTGRDTLVRENAALSVQNTTIMMQHDMAMTQARAAWDAQANELVSKCEGAIAKNDAAVAREMDEVGRAAKEFAANLLGKLEDCVTVNDKLAGKSNDCICCGKRYSAYIEQRDP